MNLPSSESRLGRILRVPLRFVPKQARTRILRGPARGLTWIAGAGPHGIWLGCYERSVQRTLARLLAEGDVFYDIGANAGFYSLLASRLVGSTGLAVAFEPLPSNLKFLRTHVAVNRLLNVVVFAAAVSNAEGISRFSSTEGRFTARLARSGDLDVQTVRLDDRVSSGELPLPTVMKLDIEGGEANALLGARSLLERVRPPILLATHGADSFGECQVILEKTGYHLEVLSGSPALGYCELLAVATGGRGVQRRLERGFNSRSLREEVQTEVGSSNDQ